jgi:hypothetical protein
MTTVAALAPDLMDRTRIEAAAAGRVTFVSSLDDLNELRVDIVVADLARIADPSGLRRVAPTARIIVFGPHVDHDVLQRARDAGIDEVLARSIFFRTVDQLLA